MAHEELPARSVLPFSSLRSNEYSMHLLIIFQEYLHSEKCIVYSSVVFDFKAAERRGENLLTESRPCSPFRLAPSRWYLLQFRVVRYHRFYRCATPRYRHAEAATIYVSRMSRVFGGTVRRPLCPFFCLLRSSTEDDRLLAVTGKMRSFVVYCNAHSGFL